MVTVVVVMGPPFGRACGMRSRSRARGLRAHRHHPEGRHGARVALEGLGGLEQRGQLPVEELHVMTVGAHVGVTQQGPVQGRSRPDAGTLRPATRPTPGPSWPAPAPGSGPRR